MPNQEKIYYCEPVFRPPSEARSLLIQLTEGCTYKCDFCISNLNKKFKVRQLTEVKKDLDLGAHSSWSRNVRKIFFLDGNAMITPTEKLLEVTNYAMKIFPNLERIGVYAHAKLARQNVAWVLAKKIQEEVYGFLKQQYEQARILEIKDTPVITVLDWGRMPERKHSPKTTRLVALGLIIGFFFGLVRCQWVIFIEDLFRNKERKKLFFEFKNAIGSDIRNFLHLFKRRKTH